MSAKFKIKGEEFGFRTITISDYYKLKEILKCEDKEAEFRIVETITGCPLKTLKTLPYTDWLLVWEQAQFDILNLSSSTAEIKPLYQLGDKTIGLPAVEDLTIGEFADLEVILQSQKTDEKLVEIAAVLYRPVIKSGKRQKISPYDPEGFAERLEEYQNLPLDAIRSANAFFLQYVNYSLGNTKASLVKQMKGVMSPEDLENLQNLLPQGPTGSLLIPSLEKTLSDLTKLRNSRSDKPLIGWLGKRTRLSKALNWLKSLKNTK